MMVNDVHARLNQTRIRRVETPQSLEELCATVRRAASEQRHIAIAGGRHAMGGQQFAADELLIDTAGLNRVLRFDPESGLVEAEAGILWPELIGELAERQIDLLSPRGVRQTQTGASRLSLGGALSANVHGRGLSLKPFVQDVESFVIVNPEGEAIRCSRAEHSDLFGLAVGGYGLFGVIYSVQLRLSRRWKMERVVEVVGVEGIINRFNERIADGFLYGDWQFNIDETALDFLATGIFSCYRPVDFTTPFPTGHRELSEADWMHLLYLAHTDRKRGFREYADYYLSTSGQLYWSDLHQLGTYIDGYHGKLDQMLEAEHPGSEIITELYVPRERLENFLAEAAEDFRRHNVRVIYGTVRLIEEDTETFLRWAKERYACVIFNLHTDHSAAGLEHTAEAFRRLIDTAITYGGNYYLTYHRFARKDQVEACYPQFREFLELKLRFDPDERFQSNWYRHYRSMFSGEVP